MKLIGSHASPFTRKVRVVLAEKKIEYDFEVDNPWKADAVTPKFNPLGKVPVLVLDDGTTLFDSRVIVQYLDTVSPVSRLIPDTGRQRIAVKRWEALADGLCDAAAAIVIERRRPAGQLSPEWIERQRAKIDLALRELAHDLGERAWCNGEAYSLADIATGCALAYLDLRHPDLDWRERYPNLVKLAEKLAKRTSFVETAPPPGA